MNESGDELPKPNYKWPWFVLAAVVLFVVLAVAWVGYAAHRENHERDFNAPLPGNPAG